MPAYKYKHGNLLDNDNSKTMKSAKRKLFSLLFALFAFFFSLWRRPFGAAGGATGNESFSLLLFAIILWIGNPVPPFVTALLAPMLAVWLGILIDPVSKAPMPRKDAADLILSFMVNRIVVVVLGSFVLSRALKKALAGTMVVSEWFMQGARSGRRYAVLLLALIALPMYASALIPHEAATMLIFNLLSPVIFALPASSQLAKTSIYALMLGGNLGGMLSTISTPQNILLFSRQDPQANSYQLTWSKWILVSLPVTGVAAVGCWVALVLGWRAWRIELDASVEPRPPTPAAEIEIGYSSSISSDDSTADKPLLLLLPRHQAMHPVLKCWTFLVSLLTVGMWMSARYFDCWLGGLSAVSLFPVVALFGAGVLDRQDLQQLPWDVILLAMGATSLSSICVHSGLMKLIEGGFAAHLGSLTGQSRLILLCVIMAFSGAVKSRYIAALVYLPLAFSAINADPLHANAAAASFLPTGQKILTAFACSAGMVLPISGLINATVSELREPEGRKQRYLKTRELVLVGTIGTVISLASILTVGQFVINRM